MNEELEGLILNLTMSFEKIIPEGEKERIEIIDKFKNYLYLAVRTIQESTSKFISKDVESIKSVLNNIANDFNKKDLNSIKQILIIDNDFEAIRKRSIEIFEIAKSKMSGKKVDVELNIRTEIEKMESLFKRVKEYNQKHAQELISEAVVDLEYLTCSNNNNLSLRLYQFKQSLSSKKEEER